MGCVSHPHSEGSLADGNVGAQLPADGRDGVPSDAAPAGPALCQPSPAETHEEAQEAQTLPSHHGPDTRHEKAKREEMQEIQDVEKQLPRTVSQGQSKANSPAWRAESSPSPVPLPRDSTINKTINKLGARIWQCSRALTGHSHREGDSILSGHRGRSKARAQPKPSLCHQHLPKRPLHSQALGAFSLGGSAWFDPAQLLL